MSKLTLLVTAMTLANGASTLAQSATSLEAELPQLVAACNGAANSSKGTAAASFRRKVAPTGRAMRACETLEKEGRLTLVEPAAVTAFQRHQGERLAACQRRQASPRGQSRAQSSCAP